MLMSRNFMLRGRYFSLRRAGDAGKGAILSRERMAPFKSPKRTRGEFPSTPDIGSLQFEDLRSLRNQMPAKCGCYTI